MGSNPICSTIFFRSGKLDIILAAAFFFIVFLSSISCADDHAGDVKLADLAGKWYNSSAFELRSELENYIEDAGDTPVGGEVVSLVAPHAGYLFSGGVAGHAFKLIRDKRPSTVLIVGFTHRFHYPGAISVFNRSAFVTPLGRAETDREVTDRLLDFHDALRDIPSAFESENSVEMLVPLAQAAVPDARIAIVAIADKSQAVLDILAEALFEVSRDKEDLIIVASTDLSHFLSHDEAVKFDALTIAKIKEMDPEVFYQYSSSRQHAPMCGYGAVYSLMKASVLDGADSFKTLQYSTSGEISGDKDRVVGYLSGAFIRSEDNPGLNNNKVEETKMFNDSQRKKILKMARDTILTYLESGHKPDMQVEEEAFKKELGVFVTLRQKGHLRGCIGSIIGEGPFYRTVMDMAVAAALQDPRFPPVSIDEMESIGIEVSVLSPMRKIDDPGEVKPGIHGVMVRRGRAGGVYLPQVALETGWSREELLDSLCADKAGIPTDSWRTGEADIYIFTAEVFGEKDHEGME